MKPKVISSKKIYEGRIFDLSSVEIRDENATYHREIISHNGSAVIIPVFDDKTVILVKQYRHAAEKFVLELPAGTIDEGETPIQCAYREVEEEIGFQANSMQKLTEFYVSPGFLSEKMYLFLATDMTQTEQNLDDDEFLSLVKLPLENALKKITSGEIEDAKTMIGLMLAKNHFDSHL